MVQCVAIALRFTNNEKLRPILVDSLGRRSADLGRFFGLTIYISDNASIKKVGLIESPTSNWYLRPVELCDTIA
jgi:hypothetical protein